jgi:hypothetical protein
MLATNIEFSVEKKYNAAMPVKSSTNGYLKEIFVKQERHFPFKIKKLNNGKLSYQPTLALHFGQ